jgi:TIR domain
MRVFVSYRRDDTAGRAGRLGDGLSTRLGAGNVFQDVGSIAPGVDFEGAILDALAATDATIVVIGPEWARLRGPDSVPRLREPADYVRQEVAAALKSGQPVVPVLVGGARLPDRDELPEELTPLLRRQAVAVRDDSWHEDVDGLVRRLQAEIEPPRSRRRPAWLLAALAAAVVLGGVVAAFWATRRDSGSSSSSPPPPCSVPDDSWTTLPLATAPTAVYELTDGSKRTLRYAGTAVRAKRRQSDWRILVDVGVSNATAPVEGTTDDEWYVDSGDFNHLVVDGLSGGDLVCFNLVSGAQELPPGQRNVVRVGYDSSTDPTRAEMILETGGPPIPLVQSSS